MKEIKAHYEIVDELDLTVGQRSLWLAHQMDLREGIYNEPIVMKLKGDLRIEILKESLSKVMQSHPALRAVFIKRDSKIKQLIRKNIEFDIPIQDLTVYMKEEKETVLKEYLEAALYKKFNLEKGPLFRFQIAKLNQNEYILHMVIHHIIYDGWSLGILIRQLSENYSELVSEKTSIDQETSYKSLIEHEDKYIHSTLYKDGDLYWKQSLQHELPYTEFPSDFNRNNERKYSGDCISKSIEPNIYLQIKSFAEKNKVSIYRVMLSAYFSLLHQMTNAKEMIVGVPINTRPRSKEADTFGYFVNTLPILVSISEGDTFQGLLSKVNERVNEAIKYQNYPVSDLVESLNSNGNINQNFLYSTAFNMVKLPEMSLPDVEVKVLTDSKRVNVFDMVWRIIRYAEKNEYKIEVDYNSDLYKSETIYNLIERFEHLLQKLILHVNEPIHSLDLLLEMDHNLYSNMNSNTQKYPNSKTLDQLLDMQALESPNQIAISMENKQITYNELQQRSNQIANYLHQNNIKKGQRVGIIMEREIDTIVSILGVLKTGGVYVPIDPNFPDSRIHYMLQDSECRIVITRIQYRDLISNFKIHTLCLDEFSYSGSSELIKQQHTIEDAAYIIYTSGSTGLPKGVVITHKGVINLSYSLKNRFSFSKNDVFLQFASIIFDASIMEIFPVLLFGGRTHIISETQKRSAEEFINVIKINDIKYCLLPTVFFKLLANMPKEMLVELSSLKHIFVGGETLPAESVRKWQRKTGLNIPIINAYGPTEATVCTTLHEVKQEIVEEQSIIPIGKPIDNSEVFVVSPSNTLCPPNVIGELYIGGEGVAKEYINQDEKTTTAFISTDIFVNSYKRTYRTGDLVRLLPNGNLEFWGRKDNQVKLRGYRIELDEIEEVLLKHSEIKDAVALIYKNKNDEIVTFYLSEGNTVIKENELKAFLNKQLPNFMLPNYLFQLEKFPLSPSGKIDRKQLELQIPYLFEKKANQYVPPTSITEEKLVEIWSNILKLEKHTIGREDDFFGLGGHSLIAVQVLNQIQKTFQLKLEIKDIFKYRTISRFSAYIDKLKKKKNGNSGYDVKVLKTKDKQYYKLSNAQKRLWFLNKLSSINRVYDTPLHICIQPSLQKNILQDTLDFLVQRHEMLRTVFIEKNGEPKQRILKLMSTDFHYENIQHITQEEQKAYINRKIKGIDNTPFDLEKGPLFRIQVFNIDAESSYLYINLHHIITDEWSVKYLLDELMKVYQAFCKGETPKLSVIPNRYIDYVEWEQNQLNTGHWDKEKFYWISEMKTPLPILNLPLDFNRPNEKTNNGDVFRIKLNDEIKESLKTVCEQDNVSMYMLFFASYIQLLHYLTDQKDIIVGTPVAGRNHEVFEQIQGFFVNTLAIRTQFHDIKNLQHLLQVVKEKCLNAFQNQSYPFDKVIEAINPDRGLSNNPVFSTMFSYQKEILQSNDQYSLELLPMNQAISKFDLSVSVEDGLDYMDVSFEYDTDLFKKETIIRFTQIFSNILQAFIKQREVPYESLTFLSEKEEALFTKINLTEKSYHFKNIQEQFYKQVNLHPNQIAIATNRESMTYKQLNLRSNQVAKHLLEQGVKRGDKVAICLDRSVDSIIAMIGILKAGGAYIPIDVKYPKDRIEYIVSDSEACRIITKHAYKNHLNLGDRKVSIVEDIYSATAEHDIEVINEPDDVAYVIYTSGSTGKPKGTLLTHKGVLNLVEWRKEVFHISELDKVTQFYSHSFDSSVSEIFSTLLNGAQLYLLSDEQRYSTAAYTEAVQEIKATISDVPTVFFNELSISLTKLDRKKIQSLRVMIMGGEAASASAIRGWQNTFQDQVQIVNEYGPTESTVSAMYYQVPKRMSDYSKNVPIGVPISNTKIHILNSHMQPCPIGVLGELYIDSIGLAKGYWKQEEKTKHAFISNPFSLDTNRRLYRTGDLAKWLPNGNVEFMGRRDKQVKIRGHRIELGEIEDAMLQFQGIKQAVVTPTKDGMLLQAYYKTVDGKEIKSNQLSLYLSDLLPEYMLPKKYFHLLEIPITANGKIDFKELPEIDFDSENKNGSIIHPQTIVQKNIAQVWSEVLNIKSISLKDDFFDLGGHSLKIMPVLVKLKPLYPNLKIQDFFKYRTLEKLAHHIEGMNNLPIKDEKEYKTPFIEKEIRDTNVYNQTKLEEFQIDVVNHPKTVLLTGATGYLGAHILERLLNLPSTVIYCLVRKDKDQVLDAKLKEKMVFYFGIEILQKMKGRVEFLEGDLSLIYLGLNPQSSKYLKDTVDSIIHCGGDVRHYGEREHFQKVNVQSTKYLLHLAKSADARFHYVSTLSVVGHAESDPNKFLFFESDFERGQVLDNVYLESKFQAEKLVRDAIKKGARATIYRVGNLVGHSHTGKFQYNINENAFYRLLKGICLSKAAPKIHTYIDLTPVDYCSLAITELSYIGNTIGQTMHICNPVQLDWEQFINNLKCVGYDILLMNEQEYMDKFFNANLTIQDQKALELIMPLLESVEEKSVSIPSCEYTQRYLNNISIHCLEPTQEYIDLLLNYAMDIGFLPETKEPIML